MSWAGSEASQVYLGQGKVGLWSPSTADAGVRWLAGQSAQEGWARVIENLRSDGKPRRQQVTVWLSGALARPFMFVPVAGLKRWSEALQVAAGLAPDATGLQGPCDAWLDDWLPGKACIAVAVERDLRNVIESSAMAEKLRITAIRPWWTAALNEAVKTPVSTPGLLAVEEGDALTVLGGEAGAFTTAACYAPRPDAAQTEALLTRALMAANMVATDVRRASFGEMAERTPFNVRLEQLA